MRLLAALGLAGLAILNLAGLVVAVGRWDWQGIGLMLFMAALLVFFAHTLWQGGSANAAWSAPVLPRGGPASP